MLIWCWKTIYVKIFSMKEEIDFSDVFFFFFFVLLLVHCKVSKWIWYVNHVAIKHKPSWHSINPAFNPLCWLSSWMPVTSTNQFDYEINHDHCHTVQETVSWPYLNHSFLTVSVSKLSWNMTFKAFEKRWTLELKLWPIYKVGFLLGGGEDSLNDVWQVGMHIQRRKKECETIC